MRSHIIYAWLGTILLVTAGVIGQPTRGIAGSRAPSLAVEQWINLPGEKTTMDIEDLRGKVVFLYGFQSWCPGCHSRGFPTLQQLIRRYEGDDDVAFIAVQTAFEGYSSNTPQRAWSTAKQYELEIPVGHSGSAGQRSKLMRNYRTGGTPWVVIIDPQGTVRYNDFHIAPDRAIALIDSLKPVSESSGIQTLPEERGGQDVLGTPLDLEGLDRWPRSPATSRQKQSASAVTLYRWWTDSCPWCQASLPAIETLRRKYGKKGLETVAIYHPKPPREVDDKTILVAADSFGYDGPVALDEDWSVLRSQYLDLDVPRDATSITFLVDRKGLIRYVHPGPVFFDSEEPEHAEAASDYRTLEKAIIQLLKEDAHLREASKDSEPATKSEEDPVQAQPEPRRQPPGPSRPRTP